MAETLRLDKALLAAGLAASRTRAHHLIETGKVTLDGVVVRKSATKVRPEQRVRVTDDDPWVSRAAHKLLGALDAFGDVTPAGQRCLDAGASTGGFTQVLLSRGAEHVVAVDVGHGQLSPQLLDHPQVTSAEGCNLRYVSPGDLGPRFGVIVADLSFISLRLVVPALALQADHRADLVLMVKPQFEIGRERLGRTGVVTGPQLRREALAGVIDAAVGAGLQPRGAVRSPLPGQDGNAEFFLWAQSPVSTAESEPDDRLVQADLDRIEFGD